ncbi:MAG: nucleotidyltransferase family protein [Dermatophilaceae bacterium]
MTTVAGLVLAAGAGRRMGGPKALVRRRAGRPTFVEATVDALWRAGLPRVVVVLGAGAEEALPLVESTGAESVVAADWAEGMGASLRTGLAYLSDTTGAPDMTGASGMTGAPGTTGVSDTTGARDVPDLALVMLVDLPDVGPGVHRRVLSAAASGGTVALARATYGGRPGHPVALGRDHWPAVVGGAAGDRGARGLLGVGGVSGVECGDLASGRDVDTPAELAAVVDPPATAPDDVSAGAPDDTLAGASDEAPGSRP